MRRVLRPHGDFWLVIGDRHDGREWAGIDGLVTRWMRRTGWSLQAKGCWAQVRSRERWDNRINYVLRFRKAGAHRRARSTTLAWMLPLPRSHRESRWDATPKAVVRKVLAVSAKRGAVLDPFLGAGTVAGRRSARGGGGSEWSATADGGARGAAAPASSRQDTRARILRTRSP